MAKWETKWGGEDSQDVGLEAAIIQRKRNSSLVQSPCAENVTGLKPCTEDVGSRKLVKRNLPTPIAAEMSRKEKNMKLDDNPNYPSKTGNPSGPGRGNAPK